MKRAKLILLENPIIETDEEIKESDGSWIIDLRTNAIAQNINNHIKVWNENCKKIISTNKQIDYNGIDFGIVDVEKLADAANGYNVYAKETKAPIFNEGYVEGFKASQQLNENKFTLEDIQDALRLGYDIGKDFVEDAPNISLAALDYQVDNFHKYLSLHKTFEIEIEETETNIKIIKKL